MMVLMLLGILAYGSFAFGKYVLSAKLFGENVKSGSPRAVSRSTSEASAVTRQTGWKGSKPRVDVKVLPANETGSSPALPAFPDEDGFDKQARSSESDDDQPSRMGTESSSIDADDASRDLSSNKPKVRRNVDEGAVQYSLGDESAKNTTRRERRSRKRRRNRASSAKKRTENESRPARTEAGREEEITPVGDGRESGDDSSISVTTERTTPRERAPRRNRERPRRETTSPVPRPENSGGDSAAISPVPQPE